MLELQENNLVVSYNLNNSAADRVGVVYSPIVYSRYGDKQLTGNYFEITLMSLAGGQAAVGLGTRLSIPSFDKLPGWVAHSYGYHSNGGICGFGSSAGLLLPKWEVGDVIGVGLIFNRRNISVYFTRNGINLGIAFEAIEDDDLCPIVGFSSGDNDKLELLDDDRVDDNHRKNNSVMINFGVTPFLFRGDQSNGNTLNVIGNINSVQERKRKVIAYTHIYMYDYIHLLMILYFNRRENCRYLRR